MEKQLPTTIDEYIADCQSEIQPRLHELRRTIAENAPHAGEKISWGMATFTHYGNLVHFAAFKKHIGFYPAPSAIIEFEDELAPYHCSKGAVQLPNDQPLPLELIGRMVIFRVREQEKLAEKKRELKKASPKTISKSENTINTKVYNFDAELKKVEDIDGAYIEFPYDVRTEFGKGRVKVHATFDGIAYNGSLVRMGTPGHIIGVTKTIRAQIGKQCGDMVQVSISERL